MRRVRIIGSLLLLIIFSPGAGLERLAVAAAPPQQTSATTYVCPMHPDVRTEAPGTCPRCGMALVVDDPLGMRDYPLHVDTTPHPPSAGVPFRLRLTVSDPDTKQVVREFVEVHEKEFHLFVISQDLSHYDHIHPVQQADGSWALDVTVPKPGFYKLYADFLPEGGTPQVIARPLVTGGFRGDLASSAARLVSDRELKKRAGDMVVELRLPPAGLVAGRDETLVYHLTDASTGAPVTELEPYLGAWGHTLIMSEDTLQFVHAHPVELLSEDGSGGGPQLTFKALLPKPGKYRAWTQLKRGGELSTAVFTVDVASPSSF